MLGKKLMLAVSGVLLVLSAGCGSPTQTARTATVTSTLRSVVTTRETVTYTPPKPAGPKTTITAEGTYLVGIDIAPGTYRQPGGIDCYWARLRSLDTSDIIDNNNSVGPQVVEILPTDKAFQTRGCATWTKVSTAARQPASGTTTSASPATTQPSTSLPSAGYSVSITGTCDQQGKCYGVQQRAEPKNDAPRLVPNVLDEGAAVNVVCQTTGELKTETDHAPSNLWYRLINGAYVSSIYVTPPGAGIPAC